MGYILRFILYLAAAVIVLILIDIALVLGFAYYQPEIEKADAVIVLGAAIHTPALTERTLTGLELYRNGKAEVMVLSGGRISEADISEAENMERIIMAHSEGASPKLLLDEDSHNTYESIKRAHELLGEKKSVIIVSDKFHLARASLLAKSQGFNEVQRKSPDPSYYSKDELQRYYIREVAAIIGYIPRFFKD